MNTTQLQPDDFSRRWYVLASVAMGIFLGTIDGGIVNIALPTLTQEFNSTVGEIRWTVLAYMITVTALMLPVGYLGDKLGKKKIYNSGFIIFTAASALCGFAPTLGWLVFFRILQAVGAAMMTSLGMAIVTENFPPAERGKALGITGTMVSIGIIAGPTIGGFIVEHFNWRNIFFVNIPIGIAGSVMAAKFIPERHHTHTHQSRSYGHILKNPALMLPLTTAFLFFAITAGLNFLLPFYLQSVLAMSSSHSGMLMGILPVILGAFAPISGLLSDKMGTRPITITGSIVAFLGFLILIFLSPTTKTLWVVAMLVPSSIGLALFQTANNSAILSAVPRHQTGITSSFVGFSRTLGFAAGVGMFSSLLSLNLEASHQSLSNHNLPPEVLFSALHSVIIVIAVVSAVAAFTGFASAKLSTKHKEQQP